MSKKKPPRDTSDNKLKLVPPKSKSPTELKKLKSRNFWNTCPLQLEFLPTRCCARGKAAANCKSNRKLPCEWAINSKEHNYCFWKWVHGSSTVDGRMVPLMQSESANFMGCSSTKIHFIEKAAVAKLRKSNYASHLAEYLIDLTKISEKRGSAPKLDRTIARSIREND